MQLRMEFWQQCNYVQTNSVTREGSTFPTPEITTITSGKRASPCPWKSDISPAFNSPSETVSDGPFSLSF